MHIKSRPAQVKVKAVTTDDGATEGTFEAIVSTWDEDSYGDVVLRGAFTDTLAEWKASGDPLPVLWSHASDDPDYHIGWVLEAEERDVGLWVRGQLDPDDLADRTSKTAKVLRLLKGRRVTQFSFRFDILDGGWGQRDGRDVYELRKLKLWEVGPTLIGVNQATDLLDVKRRKAPTDTDKPTAPEPAPVVESAAGTDYQATLAAILSQLNEIRDGLAAAPAQAENATPDVPAVPAESTQDTATDVPAVPDTASFRLRTDLALIGAEVSSLTE
jgi:HK97 family phage prohead protease